MLQMSASLKSFSALDIGMLQMSASLKPFSTLDIGMLQMSAPLKPLLERQEIGQSYCLECTTQVGGYT